MSLQRCSIGKLPSILKTHLQFLLANPNMRHNDSERAIGSLSKYGKKLRKFMFHEWHAWTDINAESRPHASTEIYVPRDEALEKRKRDAFNLGQLKGILRNIIPSLNVTDSDYLKGFSDLNSIYKRRSQDGGDQKKRSFQNIISKVQDSVEEFFKFDPPHIISSKHHFH